MENVNTMKPECFYETLDHLTDGFAAIVRLLEKPSVVMSAPEVMDAVTMAAKYLAAQYEQVAYRMRQAAEKE